MFLTPITELDAINEIVGSIGESPINTLENPTNSDVINAIRILSITNRSFQSNGWSFNIINPYILNPSTTNQKINWLDNFLYIKSTDGNKYVKRGEHLYNMTTQTDTFTSPLEVECILLVPFEDMPIQARTFITAKAAKDFQIRYLGDPTLTESLMRTEMEAWKNLQEYEMEMNNYNILSNTSVIQLKRR